MFIVKTVLISGKSFLNTIEYLDGKTNEWTTFVPKGNYEFQCKRAPRNRRNSRKSVSEDSSSRKQSIDQDKLEAPPNGDA